MFGKGARFFGIEVKQPAPSSSNTEDFIALIYCSIHDGLYAGI
jgi:hypothetical protein